MRAVKGLLGHPQVTLEGCVLRVSGTITTNPHKAGIHKGSPGLLFRITRGQGGCPVSQHPAKGPADWGLGKCGLSEQTLTVV